MDRRVFLSFMLMFLLTGFAANAQSAWSTSKDVNRVANKALFESEDLVASHIVANSSKNPSSVSMKGISQVFSQPADRTVAGNIPSKGTPAWVNSKGVSSLSNNTNKVSRPAQGHPVETEK